MSIGATSTPPPPSPPNLLLPTYGLTVVVSLAVLLLVSGSTGPTAATDAVLVTVPFLVGRTTIATVADPPSPSSPSAQLTVVPFALQRPWLALADLNRTLRSSVSVRLTPRAVSKPLFLTVTVYVSRALATTGSGLSDIV